VVHSPTWFHLDPESLHTGSTAQLLIKPQLLLHGHPTPVDILTDISATIVTTQFKGNSSNQTVSKTFENLKLRPQGDMVVAFQVPPYLLSVKVKLDCAVFNATKQEKKTFTQ